MMTLLSPEISSQNKQKNQYVRWSLLGLASSICIILFYVGPRFVRLQNQTQGSWSVPVPEYWREGWTFTGDRGWFSPTGKATMVVNRTIHEVSESAKETGQSAGVIQTAANDLSDRSSDLRLSVDAFLAKVRAG